MQVDGEWHLKKGSLGGNLGGSAAPPSLRLPSQIESSVKDWGGLGLGRVGCLLPSPSRKLRQDRFRHPFWRPSKSQIHVRSIHVTGNYEHFPGPVVSSPVRWYIWILGEQVGRTGTGKAVPFSAPAKPLRGRALTALFGVTAHVRVLPYRSASAGNHLARKGEMHGFGFLLNSSVGTPVKPAFLANLVCAFL